MVKSLRLKEVKLENHTDEWQIWVASHINGKVSNSTDYIQIYKDQYNSVTIMVWKSIEKNEIDLVLRIK